MSESDKSDESTGDPPVLNYMRPARFSMMQIRQPAYGAVGVIAGILQLAFGMLLVYASFRLATDPPREIAFAMVVFIIALGCLVLGYGTGRTGMANIQGRTVEE